MNRERVVWTGIVVALLVSGLLIGRQFSPQSSESSVTSFRWWFWASRTLDLAVQVALIFGGALGITALLPSSRKNE